MPRMLRMMSFHSSGVLQSLCTGSLVQSWMRRSKHKQSHRTYANVGFPGIVSSVCSGRSRDKFSNPGRIDPEQISFRLLSDPRRDKRDSARRVEAKRTLKQNCSPVQTRKLDTSHTSSFHQRKMTKIWLTQISKAIILFFCGEFCTFLPRNSATILIYLKRGIIFICFSFNQQLQIGSCKATDSPRSSANYTIRLTILYFLHAALSQAMSLAAVSA